ncbi:hypothetical protein SFC07_01220 [Corynebacterium callunae]|uniref:DUF7168 domain-containing protein n=1 Tax=Corynebacterium callunae TaxID=1721 RepID=UPI0039819BFF
MTTSYESHLVSSDDLKSHRYHNDLMGTIIKKMVTCAFKGWTPQDLRHEFGSHLDPLFRLAQDHITGVASEKTLEYWDRQTGRDILDPPDIATLHSINAHFNRVEVLPDWDLIPYLYRVEAFESRLMSADHLEQRHRISRLHKKAEATAVATEAQDFHFTAELGYHRLRLESLMLYSHYEDTQFFDDAISAKRIYLSAPWVRYQFQLLSAIARANDCQALLLTRSGISTVIGMMEDTTHVAELYDIFNRQRERFMKLHASAPFNQTPPSTSTKRRAFMISFNAQVSQILKDAAEQATAEIDAEFPYALSAIKPHLRRSQKLGEIEVINSIPHTLAIPREEVETPPYDDESSPNPLPPEGYLYYPR